MENTENSSQEKKTKPPKIKSILGWQETKEGSLKWYLAWMISIISVPFAILLILGIVFFFLNLEDFSHGEFLILSILWLVASIISLFRVAKQDELILLTFFGKPIGVTGAGLVLVALGCSLYRTTTKNFTFLFDNTWKKEIPNASSAEDPEDFKVTTASPKTCNWENFFEDMGLSGDNNEAKRKDIRTRIEGDKDHSPEENHCSTVLKPRISVTFTRSLPLLPLYFKNVEGENDKEKELWLRDQVQEVIRTEVNANFKLYTYAMLQRLYTTSAIQKKIKNKIDALIIGNLHKTEIVGEDMHLGIDCVNVSISALGASPEVHTATNAANASAFKAIEIATLKKGEGEGLEHLGKGQAAFINEVTAKAKKNGIDPQIILDYLYKKAMAEGGKAIYFTDGGSNNGSQQLAMANMIAEAIKEIKKGGGDV